MARLGPFAQAVTSVVPAGFDAYARLLHPAFLDGRPVRWAEVATAHGTVAHPLVQWPSLTPGEPRGWDLPPGDGNLPADVAARLAEILRPWTTTPDRCWFAVWEGWGSLADGVRDAPSFTVPGRRLHLFAGSLHDATRSYATEPFTQSANLWWPDDRAWCVATEIDLESTYLAGSRACIDAVLAAPTFEAYEVQPTDGVTWASDVVNPPLDGR